MKIRLSAVLAATLATASLAMTPLALAKEEKYVATSVITVYLSAHGGNQISEKINELHGKMEQQGWKFADLQIHSENSDTKGVWVTYTK